MILDDDARALKDSIAPLDLTRNEGYVYLSIDLESVHIDTYVSYTFQPPKLFISQRFPFPTEITTG